MQGKRKKWKKICPSNFYFGREEKVQTNNANLYFKISETKWKDTVDRTK